jgi:CheY-like chemotaxis protein
MPGDDAVIVLVEDHPLHARLLRRGLAQRLPGSHVDVLTDGTAAFRRLMDRAAPLPDLIILDLDVPGRTGHELLQDCAEDDRLRGVPAVVVTSSTLDADRDRSLALGAALHIAKPVDGEGFQRLADTLAELVSGRARARPR